MQNNPKDKTVFPRVLIVDDEPDFCKLVERMFKGKQYEVEAVSNEDEIILKIDAFKPVVIILDVYMSHMLSGYELLKTIKMRYPKIQVIMISGKAAKETKEFCLKSGAFEYLSKPVDYKVLDDVIQLALCSEGKPISIPVGF